MQMFDMQAAQAQPQRKVEKHQDAYTLMQNQHFLGIVFAWSALKICFSHRGEAKATPVVLCTKKKVVQAEGGVINFSPAENELSGVIKNDKGLPWTP